MKTPLPNLLIAAGLAWFLCGCGESKSPPANEGKTTTPAAPATLKETAANLAASAVDNAKTAAADLVSQFSQSASSQSDKLLGSIGTELADKVKSLTQAAGTNDALKAQATNTLQSLLGGHDSAAVGAMSPPASSASLTPQQVQLAKEVGNLAAAYVTQKNFSSLEGAQGDVAAIVNALRKGDLKAVVPPLQNVAQNANLTAPQKELVASLGDKYAPGLMKAAGSLQQGLKSLQGLGK